MKNFAESLYTRVSIPEFQPKISYKDSLTMIGSCFTDNISNKLDRYKYDVLSNPFGILYNPISMAKAMERIAFQQRYTFDELVLHQGMYHSMDHHGSFSGKNAEKVLDKINSSILSAHDHLKKSSCIFISPGTSKVYRYQSTGMIAGNCHKIPQLNFEYFQLRLEECIVALEDLYSFIHHVSPHARIIWTVSPVRHIKDGLVENQISKSTLLLAIDQVLKNHSTSGYFPAYEIMMDQLRDYRFYANDLIHPSVTAVDIIWDIFSNTFLNPLDRGYHSGVDKIKRAMEHRWLHEDPETIRAFARNQLLLVEEMASHLPDLNWQKERQYFFHLTEQD